MSQSRISFGARVATFLAAVVLLASSLPTGVSAEPTPAAEGKKQTYCAYLDGSTHTSYCTPKPLAEAQKECNERLKQKQLEGTCECTDDQNFIGDRCG